MARTNKDRPYRLKELDPTELREELHDHLSFGKPIYRSRRVRDSKGVVVTEVRHYKSWVPFKGYEDAEMIVPVYEDVFVGYVLDHCSLDESLSGAYDHRHWLLPCSYSLRVLNGWSYSHEYVKASRAHSRNSERAALGRARRLFNSSDPEEFEDFDDGPEFSRRQRFTQNRS